ncbi:hypothetical protein MOQ_001875 [Trypanosoma cruzi marinkellei]|uniref:Prokaryotic-type class I peptide chain release factors domain-containing protein n=1 Tax=Trypanosoma cruzi marinkellei TaxID=85056 RepID=K2NJI6_TRYCR|nr:hypothetical protein MOQ_001875 [Trypanosoma cruzi marinkellei]
MRGELSRCIRVSAPRSCPKSFSLQSGVGTLSAGGTAPLVCSQEGDGMMPFGLSCAHRLFCQKKGRGATATSIAGVRRWFCSQMPSLAVGTVDCAGTAALRLQYCCSHISSFKQEGYYRFAQLRDIQIDANCYSFLMVRGGGPGGQGSNSSSNKVELRASIIALGEHFDEELIQRLKENERGKALTADEALIVISSHEHRSAHQNKEVCLRRLREMIQKASWVPPLEKKPIERPTTIITAQKAERRKKGSIRKMQRTARKGLW